MLFLCPYGVVPRNPDSILSLSTMLASSSEATAHLSGTGQLRMGELEREMSSFTFQTMVINRPGRGSTFAIEVATEFDGEKKQIINQAKVNKANFYRPISTRWPVVISAFALQLGLIASLEAIQQISDTHNGIASIPSTSSTGHHVLINYIPAAVMLILALIYSSLDFLQCSQ